MYWCRNNLKTPGHCIRQFSWLHGWLNALNENYCFDGRWMHLADGSTVRTSFVYALSSRLLAGSSAAAVLSHVHSHSIPNSSSRSMQGVYCYKMNGFWVVVCRLKHGHFSLLANCIWTTVIPIRWNIYKTDIFSASNPFLIFLAYQTPQGKGSGDWTRLLWYNFYKVVEK